MSELFDKEVNAQKESLKKTFGVHASSRMPTKKCAMKMKETNKQRNKETKTTRVYKSFWWKEALYKAQAKNWGKRSPQASIQRFWTQ